jgi:hypothetical protein
MNVIFRPLAVEDTVEAAAWYEERAPGLGDELIDEILAAADRARQTARRLSLTLLNSFFATSLIQLWLTIKT